jgi:hypothetical protein
MEERRSSKSQVTGSTPVMPVGGGKS